MKETKPNAPTQQEKDHAVDHLPGAAVDHADKNKVYGRSLLTNVRVR